MAGNKITLNAPAVPIVAATPKSVIMVTAPANQAVVLKGMRITLDGANSAATPATVEGGRPSSAGTFTSATPGKKDPGRQETVQTTGGINASAEPTWTGVVLETLYLGTFNGLLREFLPFDSPITVPGGTRYAIRVTAGANVNCSAVLDGEE